MREKSEILPLTGLRAVAALYVFLFHMQIRWPYVHNPFSVNLIGAGAVGMSVFFVLSGFVLAYQYSNSNVGYRQYAINRFARIYPIYAICALLSLPWIGLSINSDTVLSDSARVIALVASNILVVQAWVPHFFTLWNDSASWSISVEMFCYALLPVMLKYMAGATNKQLAWVAALAYIAGTFPSLVSHLFDAPPRIVYSMPIFRLPEFVLGVCACIAMRSGWRIPGLTVAILLTACVLALGILSFTGSSAVVHNWIVLPAVAASIAFLASTRSVAAKLLASRVAVFLGKISYCIYSLQVFIILPLISHHAALVERIPVLSQNWLLLLASLSVLLVASTIAHYAIEEPARRWIKGWSQSRHAHSPVRSIRTPL